LSFLVDFSHNNSLSSNEPELSAEKKDTHTHTHARTHTHTHTHTWLSGFCLEQPGEPVPEEHLSWSSVIC